MRFESGLLLRMAGAVLVLLLITVLLPLSVGGLILLAFLYPMSLGRSTPPTVFVEYWPAFAAGIGLFALVILALGPVRREVRAFRADLGVDGDPACETHPELARRVERLARQADIPEPEVYVASRSRAECYTLGAQTSGTVVVSQGAVDKLSGAELDAVLAHEVSHLANGDSRIMSVALVPMLFAEQLRDEILHDDGPSAGTVARNPGTTAVGALVAALVAFVAGVLKLCAQAGVALLSRGRELAADRGAARLTGSPAALASALERLDDSRTKPGRDLRRWHDSAGALDILPSDEMRLRYDGALRTHPPTENRIERLRELARETER